MLIDIKKLQINDRIRKDYGDIPELAEDIKENGLINPPVVTPDFVLIAGERRVKALEYLNYQQIEVRVMVVTDYMHQLNLEISENESRKEFTKKERFEYTQKLIELKRLNGVNLHQAEEEAAAESGIGSRKQLYKEKAIIEQSDNETLDAWDKGDITTHAAYQRIANEKKQLESKLQKIEIENSDKDLQIGELKLEVKSLMDKSSDEPITIEKVPDDYEALKRQVEILKNSDRKAREEASQAKKEAEAYKHSLETWKSGGKSMEQISLPDFKIASRKYMEEVSPLAYMGELFRDVSESEKSMFREVTTSIRRLLDDVEQAIDGNAGGANIIILEGGKTYV